MLLLACSLAIDAQLTGSLTTRQTTLTLYAGSSAPRLLSLQCGSRDRRHLYRTRYPLQGGRSPTWRNELSEALIASVEEDGHRIAVQWKLDRQASRLSARSASFVYQSTAPRLRLTWKWNAPAEDGPIEHSIAIENQSSSALWLPLQDSFRFRFPVNATLRHEYIDKGAGKPTEVGTHEVAVPVGYRWTGRSSTYARNEGEREIIPWFMIEREAHDGWYVGIEFSGRTSLSLERDGSAIEGAVGLDPDPGPYRTRLLPNETFTAPTVFVGAFRGGPDGAGNILRPWVRRVLNNPVTWKNPAYPPLVNNSWGSGMQVDETLALRMLRDSAELGLELLHIDAGWFRGVGDWYPSPGKFPHGLAPIAEEAHRRGLRFGIWVNWAEAGIDENPDALSVRDPKIGDWLVADVPQDWRPADFVGRTIDLGFPPASEYAHRELERIITEYHLDMLEHDGYVVAKNCSRADHPHAAGKMSTIGGSGIAMPDTSNSTDVSYYAARAYYSIYAQVRREHPDLLLEICDDGGRMVDFGSAAHGDYFSITDSYDPLSNRRAFYDASHLLPAAMLEDYVMKWPAPKLENFRYMLRSGMMGMLTIMQDTNQWTGEEHAAAKAEFALYKQKLRPLIRDAGLYHVSARPDGVHWDGMEYFDRRRGTGVLYAFRGTAANENRHTFLLQGLEPGHTYRLHFTDRSAADRTMTGRKLTVGLPLPLSSELVFIDDNSAP